MAVVPFHREHRAAREERYVAAALRNGLASPGEFTERCETILEERLRAERVLLVPSCTSALEIAAMLVRPAGHRPSEALFPGYTFASGPAAFVIHGHRPVFVDVDPLTGSVDLGSAESALTPATTALVPTHYGGVTGPVDEYVRFCDQHGLVLIEDAAQALGATWRGAPAGTHGALSAISFHSTKNVSCGEGGALVINDPAFVARAEVLREKGTNRRQFLRGERDCYTWLDSSASHIMSELQAAVLLAQLEELDEITRARRAHVEAYRAAFAPLAAAGTVSQMPDSPERQGNGHSFHLLFATRDERDSFIEFARADGIRTASHFVALQETPNGAQWLAPDSELPGVTAAAEGLVRLPVYPDLTPADRDRVIEAVKAFIASRVAK